MDVEDCWCGPSRVRPIWMLKSAGMAPHTCAACLLKMERKKPARSRYVTLLGQW